MQTRVTTDLPYKFQLSPASDVQNLANGRVLKPRRADEAGGRVAGYGSDHRYQGTAELVGRGKPE
jgi:hypothetical protein